MCIPIRYAVPFLPGLRHSVGRFWRILRLVFFIPAAFSRTWVRIAPVIMTSNLRLSIDSKGFPRCGIASFSLSVILLSSNKLFNSKSGKNLAGIPTASFRWKRWYSPSARALRPSHKFRLAVYDSHLFSCASGDVKKVHCTKIVVSDN